MPTSVGWVIWSENSTCEPITFPTTPAPKPDISKNPLAPAPSFFRYVNEARTGAFPNFQSVLSLLKKIASFCLSACFASSPVGNFVFRKTFGSLMARAISAPRFRWETNSMPRNLYWSQLDWPVGSWTEHRRWLNRLKIS